MPSLLKKTVLAFGLMLSASFAFAQAEKVIELNLVNEKGVGESIGTVVAKDTPYGLMLTPNLKGLPPGLHGFHIHANPNCGISEKDGKITPAGAAGGHYDPQNTGKHEGPWGNGHLGDLPALYVNADGTATYPVVAPRLKLSDIEGRAIMFHAGGENHSDQPAALGGGGARLACGVIK